MKRTKDVFMEVRQMELLIEEKEEKRIKRERILNYEN